MKPFPQPNLTEPARQCADALLEVVPTIIKVIRRQMRAQSGTELSIVQFRALALLQYQPGASFSQVKEHLGITLPSASKLIHLLIKRGYIRRQLDPKDRRRSMLTPTDRGRRLIVQARNATRDSLALTIARLDETEARTVLRALRLLQTAFQDQAHTLPQGQP